MGVALKDIYEPSCTELSSCCVLLRMQKVKVPSAEKHFVCRTFFQRQVVSDWKKKDPDFRNKVPWEPSPHFLLGAQNQRAGAGKDQLPCGYTGACIGTSQGTKTCTVRACHTIRKPPQNHPSGHLGGWATRWSAAEMLDG